MYMYDHDDKAEPNDQTDDCAESSNNELWGKHITKEIYNVCHKVKMQSIRGRVFRADGEFLSPSDFSSPKIDHVGMTKLQQQLDLPNRRDGKALLAFLHLILLENDFFGGDELPRGNVLSEKDLSVRPLANFAQALVHILDAAATAVVLVAVAQERLDGPRKGGLWRRLDGRTCGKKWGRIGGMELVLYVFRSEKA